LEHRRRGRQQRIIAAPGGSREAIRRIARERPGNNPAEPVFAVQKSPCFQADLVEFLNGYDVLMGRDLKNAVRRSVDDRLAGPEMFRAEIFQYDGSG
jgi:hypothetical protein